MSYKYTYGARKQKSYKLTLLFVGLLVVSGVGVAANSLYDLSKSPAHLPQLSRGLAAGRIHLSSPQISTNYSLPARLQIPKLKVDAHVIYTGLTKDGDMSVPANVIDAGWYKYGALPGNTGTAVIAGHLDGLRGEPGVFSNLNELIKGDTFTVTETNGQVVSFTVRETRSYPQNEQPVEVFNSSSGSHLNLITCTGNWDSSAHRFAKRLVVFADKAS